MDKIEEIDTGKLTSKQHGASFNSTIATVNFQQVLESEISRTAIERELAVQGVAYLPYRYAYLKSPIYLINKKSR